MAMIVLTETAAGTGVGTNLIVSLGTRAVTSPRYRYIRRIGVTGSSAAYNASVDVFYGQTYIGTFFNTTSGAVGPVDAKDFMTLAPTKVCEPGEQLSVVISKSSATNAMTIVLDIVEFG